MQTKSVFWMTSTIILAVLIVILFGGRARSEPLELLRYTITHLETKIVISNAERKLYLMQGNAVLKTYGVAIGRDGFVWRGVEKITRKAEWPDWRPPPAMIARQPYLPRVMAGGPGNPLGARALYLGQTEYRIHGTNEPKSIGYAISSGCFRMMNSDILDLYERVRVGMAVEVR